MLLVVLSLLLCACANGLAVGEGKASSSPLKEGPAHLRASSSPFKEAAAPLKYRAYPGLGRFLFDPAPLNWTEASKVCRLYNGHLVFPSTRAEADVLWSIMAGYNVSQVHLGFHDQFIEGEYYTSSGKMINGSNLFNEWTSEVSVGSNTKNCGGLRDDGLVDVDCKDLHPSICGDGDTSSSGGLPGYDYIEGHGYYKYYPARTWPEAFKVCYNEGAHLWIINSEQEKTAVFRQFNITDGNIDVWVGVHHRHADRYFVTIFDEPLAKTGYIYWAPTEPNGSQAQFPYVSVRISGLRIMNAERPFVCEYNPLQ